jgi:hypothetical protein
VAKSQPPREVEQLAQQSLRQASLARPSLQFRHRCWLSFERALDPLATATQLTEREPRRNRNVRSADKFAIE